MNFVYPEPSFIFLALFAALSLISDWHTAHLKAFVSPVFATEAKISAFPNIVDIKEACEIGTHGRIPHCLVCM
jgi:hypothetical protein